jgi:hypothetical protein
MVSPVANVRFITDSAPIERTFRATRYVNPSGGRSSKVPTISAVLSGMTGGTPAPRISSTTDPVFQIAASKPLVVWTVRFGSPDVPDVLTITLIVVRSTALWNGVSAGRIP